MRGPECAPPGTDPTSVSEEENAATTQEADRGAERKQQRSLTRKSGEDVEQAPCQPSAPAAGPQHISTRNLNSGTSDPNEADEPQHPQPPGHEARTSKRKDFSYDQLDMCDPQGTEIVKESAPQGGGGDSRPKGGTNLP